MSRSSSAAKSRCSIAELRGLAYAEGRSTFINISKVTPDSMPTHFSPKLTSQRFRGMLVFATLSVLLVAGCFSVPEAEETDGPQRGDIIFAGGFATDPEDEGRPVALIAAALDIEPQVFRAAFKNVVPAKDGEPSEAEKKANKKALLDALREHGVTNEQLDKVSDFYRYRPQAGEIWEHRMPKAKATVRNKQVQKIVVSDAGFGLNSIPTATIHGYEKIPLKVELKQSTDLDKNGSVKVIRYPVVKNTTN